MKDRQTHNAWSMIGWGSVVIGLSLLLVLLLFGCAAGQQRVSSVDIVRSGYWQVVSPDTITNHTDQTQAIERQLNLMLAGVDPVQIVIKPPLYEVRPSYAGVKPDTVFLNRKHELVRGIGYNLITPNPDTTDFYSVQFRGESDADQVKVVTNCYDGKHQEKFGVFLEKDATGFHYTSPDTLDCRGIMTWWTTGIKDTTRVLSVDFIDIGHQLWIGNE